jgi:SAM-dependent methyltransferase
MAAPLSPRLAAVVDALPLAPGLRVLEFGCGPGAAAREVARRVGPAGFVLGVDRSAKAIQQALAFDEQPANLAFRQSSIDAFELEPGEPLYDLAFAIRVGALDGRHPDQQAPSLARIAAALVPGGRLYIDGGDPLRELTLR